MKKYKFQLNISKIMPARPKEQWGMGCEYQNGNLLKYGLQHLILAFFCVTAKDATS